MKRRRLLYGLTGSLSLLGLLGLIAGETRFLPFLAFAVDFWYFFAPSDEMMEEYMNRSAARAFFLGMAAVALATLFAFLFLQEDSSKALLTGLSMGWVVSVLTYALSTAYYGFRENWGLDHD